MKTKAESMVTVDSDAFFKEYKRIAKEYGGVASFTKLVAPNNHSHYLSCCKRHGRISKDVFNNLIAYGADRDKMLGTKRKDSRTYSEVSTIMYEYLTKLVTSDGFRTSFIKYSANYLRKEVAK